MNEAESASAEATALGSVLAPYVGISDDFMAIVLRLHQAGVGVATLDCAVGATGQDLWPMIRRFFETARGLKDARL